MNELPHAPLPPDFRVPWDDLAAAHEWVRGMASCPQDPLWHAEGDVATHTRMVLEALCAMEEWRRLPEADRAVVFWGALLHDVAKPAVTVVEEGGRITSRGHSRRGAILARSTLWRLGAPPLAREHVCHLVRLHELPFFLIDRTDAQRLAIEASWHVRCDLLALVAEADARGRRCEDAGRLLDNVALFREHCGGESCLSAPHAFPSDHARFLYFRDPQRTPYDPAHEEFSCTATILSGLPASGKDRWIERNRPGLPVVSLDAIRHELGLPASGSQGAAADAARQRVKEHLRARRDFVFNATSLTRDVRDIWIGLFARYGARVEIVAIEAEPAAILARNRQRERPVPERVIERMLSRWEAPAAVEAHALRWVT